ncbi:TonB-dependent receptor [bacterium]|nr:TonB-dependent receptor [bacterium]
MILYLTKRRFGWRDMRVNWVSKTSLSLTLATMISAAPVYADSFVLTEEAFYTDIPVVATATRLEQKITDAPVAISIIDRDMIRASGATEIPELLNLIPGFASYYVHGSILAVTNRGLASDYPGDLEVTIDGRSIYEPLFSAVEWISQYITVDDIAYIEVVRGSNVPTSGSNAFLGAINIVTRSSLEGSDTRVTTTLGDIDTRKATLRQNIFAGDMQLRFGLSYRHDRGFPQLPTHFNRDGNEAVGGAIDGLYSLSVNNRLEFAMGYMHGRIEDPDNEAVTRLV